MGLIRNLKHCILIEKTSVPERAAPLHRQSSIGILGVYHSYHQQSKSCQTLIVNGLRCISLFSYIAYQHFSFDFPTAKLHFSYKIPHPKIHFSYETPVGADYSCRQNLKNKYRTIWFSPLCSIDGWKPYHLNSTHHLSTIRTKKRRALNEESARRISYFLKPN